ncbi:MAG: PucR family transcriptional regulator ligand-binding domain-containing protein [Peptostreptococcaceae bacterium]|nr:PucR family transcriptional regulator ligand-binding domain-containing protein [Peptostreptococcaceae bacterium]
MITVMELVAHPAFKEFKLLAGESGLYNPVLGTAIFEWESPDDVERTFSEGEFVVTTLSQAKNDVSLAEKCIKLLIKKGVCAIGIKTVYFKEISEELKLFADENKIPIFFFLNTYFDDIIFTIKNALISNSMNTDYESKLTRLLKANSDSDTILEIAKEINPFFLDNIICCFASLNNKKLKNEEDIEQTYTHIMNQKYNKLLDSKNLVYSIISYEGGILIIYTVKSFSTDICLEFMDFLDKNGINNNDFKMGFSNSYLKLENLAMAVQESIYANASCIIDNEPILFFDSIGLDRMLMPVRNDAWTKRYYDSYLEKILAHDVIHNSKIMETLIEYVKSNGDIKLTGKNSFQHSNTIRYRLEKAKKLLNIDESLECYPEIFTFIRLYQINKILKKE